MALIVHKYGGTSMGSTERIKNVAKRVAKWARAGHQMIVVPSAMSGETNRLLGLAKELATGKPGDDYDRELDMLASTGEQASSALLAIALQAEGLQAVSYAGWQVQVKTDSAFTKARIESIDDERVRADLDAGKVVVITGFQGVDDAGNITTLGRGGSDTSAVAIAAALKANECLIYTDVDGVYTTDPRVEPDARRLVTVSFEEMLEMASLGSKVLQIRSVEFAPPADPSMDPADAAHRRVARRSRCRPWHAGSDGKAAAAGSALRRPRCSTGRCRTRRLGRRRPRD